MRQGRDAFAQGRQRLQRSAAPGGQCPVARAEVRPRHALERRPQRVLTPLNAAHRAVVMAVERGKLQHLIFDNQILWHHRALAAVLGVILRLPPVARAMATDQVKSRYLEALALRYS